MKFLTILVASVFTVQARAQKMNYQVDLTNCVNDQLKIELSTSYHGKDTALFSFPMTVPGTYAVLDYGRFISQFQAFDSNGKALKIKKKSKNSYVIFPGKDVAKVTYTVDDSWEEKNGSTKIFEPAGTGFEAGKYFYINSGGLFGYFGMDWNNEIEITYLKPLELKGYTTLVSTSKSDNKEVYRAINYHELIDNPILFTGEKAENIQVRGTDVIIASYHPGSKVSAVYIKDKIDSTMVAIDKFVGGQLPVANYAFLNFVQDYTYLEPIFNGEKKVGLLEGRKIMKQLEGQSYGALEHGHSSSYFLPDFGSHSYVNDINETGIHEFLHIYAPLSLHSQYIGEFNYSKPIMSKHLWLYEGTTEYFSVLVSMQGELKSVKETVEHSLKDKILSAAEYPDTMAFTTMSAHVFDKPYSDYYDQVYQRGAIMAWLLDIEIMRLTNGAKTLKSVVFELSNKYGSTQSFDEETFIDEFVALVHPDLKQFFTDYVEGGKPLPIDEKLNYIGISFKKKKDAMVPADFFMDQHTGVKPDNRIINGMVKIKEASENNAFGIKKNDIVDYRALKNAYKNEDGSYVKEGTMITITVERKGKEIPLTFQAHFKPGYLFNVIEILKELTPEQQRLFQLWSTGKL